MASGFRLCPVFGARKTELGLFSSPRVLTVFVEEIMLKSALERYPRYLGQLSLTDGVSVVVIEKYHTKEVFSHDSDFDRIEGITRKDSL